MEQTLVHTARSWLNTPFMHQGRKKHLGCDCIGLVIGTLEEMGVCFDGKLPSELDQRDYSMQPQGKRLVATLNHYLTPVPLHMVQAGKIALMRFEKEAQHVGIIGEKQVAGNTCLTLIHCYQGVGKVVEHYLDVKWQQRLVRLYRL